MSHEAIKYYVDSMMSRIVDKTAPLEVAKIGCVIMGAIGYANMRGDLSVSEWVALTNQVQQACDKKIASLTNGENNHVAGSD